MLWYTKPVVCKHHTERSKGREEHQIISVSTVLYVEYSTYKYVTSIDVTGEIGRTKKKTKIYADICHDKLKIKYT